MGSLFEWITDWIKEGLIDAITGQYTSIFISVNNQVADVANQVGQTPQDWNGGVFSMIQNLSETVVIPIAGMILTFVLVYELIQMILEKNNMHEFDTFNIFKWIFKTFVATYLLTNCFTIVMAVFDVAQNVVSQSAGVINGNLDVQAALSDLETQLEAMGMWELIGLWLETNIINLCMWVLSIVIFVIVYGRMIEIYLTVSLAPIPFSTMANREWGQMGTGYLRSLFALGFQGFLILICVAIYAVLVQSIPSSGDVHGAIWGTAGYTVLLAFPVYFFTRGAIGNSAAVLLMIGLMMPFFFFAMYERDGQPAEKILKNRLRYKLWPKDRPYRTDNLYKSMSKKEVTKIAKKQAAGSSGKASAKKYQAGQKDQSRCKAGKN